MSASPLVSVVIATYNRADILPYAIQSVLLNKGIDLEVIVVGDACTDDTGEAVAAVRDSRITFVNLPRNWGEQSVPSNEGIARARGEFVAFLNHDDLFLPWHLANLLAVHRAGADVAWCPYFVVYPPAESASASYALTAVTASERFDPLPFIVASATSYKKSVLAKVGGWTRASQTRLSPSQDLLFKAHKAGFEIRRTDTPSLLVFYTGDRKDAYITRSALEHRRFFDLMRAEEGALYAELLRASVQDAARMARMSAPFFMLKRLYARIARLGLRLFGIHPQMLLMLIRYCGRRGALVNHARRVAGLPAIDFQTRDKSDES